MPRSTSWKQEAALLSVVLIWGLNFIVMKLVLEVMHPHVMNMFRLLASGLVLGYVYWVREGRSVTRCIAPLRTHFGPLLRLGIVGWVLYQIAFIVGLDYTTAENAALIMASPPLWTALLATVMGIERLSLAGWFGLLISLCGTITVVLFGSDELTLASDLLLGNVIMLGAAIMWGAYTTLTKPLVTDLRPMAVTVLALLIVYPVIVAVGIPFWTMVEWHRVTWLHWAAIILSGSLSTGVAIAVWNTAVQKLGASHTAAFNNLVPFVAVIAGFLILDDPLFLAQLIGGVLIISGLAVMRRARSSRRTV
ncbi:MAG: DMT family transporter [Rhodothermales bacterium]|nr:DMT family transporter [Rhodothermales bacterium]